MSETTKHTKEPWQLAKDGWIEAETEVMVAICPLTGRGKANMNRIIACVNACAGFPTKDLEKCVVNRLKLL